MFSTIDLLPDNLPEDVVRQEDKEILDARKTDSDKIRRKGPRRKHQKQSQPDNDDREQPELLVFGYSSSLFRDDKTASRVENGELLIPWQNEVDNPIMLDRFDVRNLLDDRDSFRKVNYTMSVRPSEKEEERLCEIERYADVDSEEEMLWDFSEDERIAYVGDKRERRQIEDEEKSWKEAFEASRPKPDFELHIRVPEEMITPLTKRQFAIIERTATFLNQSPATPNMEIVIQTKQSGNPDFSFLNTLDDLYPFYRHVRELMKTGEYVQLEVKTGTNLEESENPQQSQTSSSVPLQKSIEAPAAYSGPIPSTETKVIIDKTAVFVARAGPALEGRLRERNAGNPRFNFLNPWNEYYAYWKFALQKASAEEKEKRDDSKEMENRVLSSTPIPFVTEKKKEKQTKSDDSKEMENQVLPSTPTPSVTEKNVSSSPCETVKPESPISPPKSTIRHTSSATDLSSPQGEAVAPSSKTQPMTISTDKDSQARRRRRAEEFLAKRRREASSTTDNVPEYIAPRSSVADEGLNVFSDETVASDPVLKAEAAAEFPSMEKSISENVTPRTSVNSMGLNTSSNETEASPSISQAEAAPRTETSATLNVREIEHRHIQRYSPPSDESSKIKTNASKVGHEDSQADLTEKPKLTTEPKIDLSANSDRSSPSSSSRIASHRKRSRQDVSDNDDDSFDSRIRRHGHRSKEESKDRRKHHHRRWRSRSPQRSRKSRHHRPRNGGASSDVETIPRTKSSTERRQLGFREGSEDRHGRDRDRGLRRSEGSRKGDKRSNESSDHRIDRERSREDGGYGNKQR